MAPKQKKSNKSRIISEAAPAVIKQVEAMPKITKQAEDDENNPSMVNQVANDVPSMIIIKEGEEILEDLEDNGIETEIIDEKEQEAYLERVFEEQMAAKIKSLPKKKLTVDKKLKTKLKPHQVDGIRWLISQERSTSPNPFFKEMTYSTGTKYRCSLTGHNQDKAPKPIQGALLADDMGLGKTLQTIGLILSNAPESSSPRKVTLIVSPVSAMANWMQQIDQHVREGNLRVHLYQGPKRNKMVPAMMNGDFDIVVASYDTLRSDHTIHQTALSEGRTPGHSLCCFEYHRIVLDEAHLIRNPSSKYFRAAMSLNATHKVALTGTPFVNRPEDLWAQMAFLGVEPLTKRMLFEEQVTLKIKQGRPCGLARLRAAMSYVSLRRTKKTIDLGLKNKTTVFMKVPFTPGVHNDVHEALYSAAQTGITAVMSDKESEMKKEATKLMFLLLVRIRQACCSAEIFSPEFREKAMELGQQPDESTNLSAEEGLELLSKVQGLSELMTTKKGKTKTKDVKPEQMDAIVAALGGMNLSKKEIENFKAKVNKKEPKKLELTNSPKVAALIKLIESDMKPDEKGVIFSSFTSFLDLIEPALEAKGITFNRLDGSMDAEQRVKALKEFDVDDGPRVILCSLKAAGLGISLTRGNVAFMMDPWWNQAVEDQAADRVHRMGQTREVRIYRLVMTNSIEERLVSVQSRKAALGKGSMEKLSAKEEKRAKLTAMKDLFEIDDAVCSSSVDFWGEFTDSDDDFIVGDVDDDDESSSN
ncbi:hypothetical protein ACA910_019365 [Epithemia clementina (nom. ined.)]